MAQKLATEQLAIADWVKGLAAIPVRDFTLQSVQDYVVRHAVLPETIEKYCYFSKGSYTRNLIFKNDLFECMTVCWEVGQHSRIHNHFQLCRHHLSANQYRVARDTAFRTWRDVAGTASAA